MIDSRMIGRGGDGEGEIGKIMDSKKIIQEEISVREAESWDGR